MVAFNLEAEGYSPEATSPSFWRMTNLTCSWALQKNDLLPLAIFSTLKKWATLGIHFLMFHGVIKQIYLNAFKTSLMAEMNGTAFTKLNVPVDWITVLPTQRKAEVTQ